MTVKLANPSTPKEWEEYVNGFDTPEAFFAAFKDGSFTTALNAYKSASNGVMDDIKAQVKEQTQIALADMLKRNGQASDPLDVKNRIELVEAARKRATLNRALYSDKAPGAGLNGQFDNVGSFLQAAIANPNRLNGEALDKHRFLAEYSEKVPSEGGFLVPEEFRSDILSVALEASIVRPRATVVPMNTGKLKYPAVDFTTEVGEVLGGIIMYWMDEGGTIPDTDAAFAALELIAHKLGGAAVVPNELVRDVAAFATWIMTNLPKAVAHFEDVGFLKGNGVKKPLGALHADNPALITASKEVGQPAATITWNNVLAMFARLLPESYDQAVWTVTPDAIPELYTMAIPVGTGGSAVMVGNAESNRTAAGAVSPAGTLLGLPIKFTRKAPAVLGTKGDISLVDYSTYLIGDTQDMRIDSSEHVKFLQDKTAFKVIERVDGQPQLLSTLTPENGGPTLSAYVQLETRS